METDNQNKRIIAKKSLGQNFLKSGRILDNIVKSADITKSDIVLEIGPGMGALTEKLLETAGKVIAVEKDDRLISVLEEKFAQNIKNRSFSLIHDDILEQDISKIGLNNGEFKLVANIPYYITGMIIRMFLSGNLQPSKMVLLVQKEVAERIIARDKKESLLSISVKVYGEPKIMGIVAKGNFNPVPNVDSAILSVSGISKNFFTDITEDSFFEVLKAGFAHKRKKLFGNIKHLLGDGVEERILNTTKLDKNCRAEDLTIEQWKQIVLEKQ